MTDTWLTETHREGGRRRIAAGEARTALIRRRYDASIEDVWEACTDPDRMGRWFIKPKGDLRGGTFSLEGNARRRDPPVRATTPAQGDVGLRGHAGRRGRAAPVSRREGGTPCWSLNTPRSQQPLRMARRTPSSESGSVGRSRWTTWTSMFGGSCPHPNGNWPSRTSSRHRRTCSG
jgi:hypothetical protein